MIRGVKTRRHPENTREKTYMSQADTKQDTKQLILDAAERLFARNGFHNTSLRSITSKAGVNLAAVNYHFGSKGALLDKVFERRLLPLNKIRQDKLEDVRNSAKKQGRRPGVEDVLRAFIEPTLCFRNSGQGAEDFIVLVGRTIHEPDNTVLKIFLSHVDPLFNLIFEILQEALPDIPKDHLFWRLQFTFGALGHTMCKVDRLQFLSEGLTPGPDTNSLTQMLVQFVTAGMETT